MNILVTYASRYGHTKRYAQWIAQALDCDILDCKNANSARLEACDVMIHGGGIYAGGLSGIDTLVKNWSSLSGKDVILFSCGLADPTDPQNAAHIKEGIARSLTPEMEASIRQFYFRGGIDYPRLSLVHRAMMAMMRKMLLKKGYETLRGEDKTLIDTYGQTLDYGNRDTIEPLIAYVHSLTSV